MSRSGNDIEKLRAGVPAGSSDDEQVVRIRGLHKRYDKVEVLNGLDLTVRQGEIVGCLGRNGAGKSTLIRILMGITSPDKGLVRVLGSVPDDNVSSLRQQIGYVAQEQNFYPWMTTRSIGRFTSRFYRGWDAASYAGMLQLFGLPENRKVDQFSVGMKAQLALALALASRPRLLLLDEPAAGLDPVARREFLNQVSSRSRQIGTTTIFSSHLIDDVELIADRLCIVDNGRTFYEGELAPLANSVTAVSATGDNPASIALPDFLITEPHRILHDSVTQNRRRVVFTIGSHAAAGRDAAIAAASVITRDLMDPDLIEPPWQKENMSLEDVFVSLLTHDN